MRKTELYFIALCIIGIGLHAAKITGSVSLCTISFLVFALFYFFFNYFLLENIPITKIFKKETYQNSSFTKIAGGIIAGILYGISVSAFLFYVLFWTGAKIMLFGSCILMFPLLITSIVTYSNKKTEYSYQRLIRTIVFSIIGLLLYFGGSFR